MFDDSDSLRWRGSWAIVSGALVGAMAGYLLRTRRGRRLCDAVIQTLDDFSFECVRFCQAAGRAQMAAADSWDALKSRGPIITRARDESIN
jgi:hypothetical protein